MAVRAPGRVELVGKHTDYAGGRSLTLAIDRAVWLVAAGRRDRSVTLLDPAGGKADRFEIAAGLDVAAPGWRRYPRTVARRLARDFGEPAGADVAWQSDLPPAAGLSSSSALVVAVYLALAALGRLAEDAGHRRHLAAGGDLAEYLAAVESGAPWGPFAGDLGVGTLGGSEDHVAILCGRAGRVGQYRYLPVRRERSIRWPAGHRLAVAVSGVVAEKSGSARAAYNQLSRQAARAAAVWNERAGRSDPHLGAATEAAGAERLLAALAGEPGLADRCRHFLTESEEIVPAAGEALAAGELAAFGQQCDRSQELAETLLGNQPPETVFLARRARELGAAAASASGAGFGGSVWALVEAPRATSFLEAWAGAYAERFPRRAGAELFLARAAAPAGYPAAR